MKNKNREELKIVTKIAKWVLITLFVLIIVIIILTKLYHIPVCENGNCSLHLYSN